MPLLAGFSSTVPITYCAQKFSFLFIKSDFLTIDFSAPIFCKNKSPDLKQLFTVMSQQMSIILLACCLVGSRDGAVVSALASHQSGPGSIPGLGVICGLSLLLVLVLAPRGFSPGTPVFPSPKKPTLLNSNLIWKVSPISALR